MEATRDTKQYVNEIVKKIKCGRGKKEEIRKQLATEIDLRIEQGEKPEDIISQMGDASEIAGGFNENLSEQERKQYKRNKGLCIAAVIVVLLAAAGIFLYAMTPKSVEIEESEIFDKQQVEEAMKNTVELLDAEDYEGLYESAIAQMQSDAVEEQIETAKAQLSGDWGERESFGAFYIAEVVQGKQHYATGQVTVSYENVTVTYTLTYDADMKLAGIYLR